MSTEQESPGTESNHQRHDAPGGKPEPRYVKSIEDAGAAIVSALNATIHHIEAKEERDRKTATWNMIKRAFFTILILAVLGFYLVFYGSLFGVNTNPSREAVAVIGIHGAIAKNQSASADNINPLIRKACRTRTVKVIALEINSPGGAPNEAERIGRAIQQCRQESNKEVVAVLDSLGASAAYMVAMKADKIVAGKYTMVGSIGAIMRYLDASQVAERIGLDETIFRSGNLKGGPSLLSGGTEDLDAVNQEMVSELGRAFLDEVYEDRGERLVASRDDVFSGRIWTAEQSLKMGLIDEIGTIETLAASDWEGLKLHRYRPKTGIARGMGFEGPSREWLDAKLTELSAPRIE